MSHEAAVEPEWSPDEIPPRPLTHHLALTVFWLANTTMWGALLHIGIQSRLTDWYGQDRVGYFMGILGFLGAVVATIAQIVAGAFSDRSLSPWGRRRPFLVVGTLMSAVALMGFGLSRSYWPFLGAYVLVQLFTNGALGPFTALLPDTVNPREHGKASGFMGAARLLGDMGGLILAGVLLSAGPQEESMDLAARVAFHDERMPLLSGIMAAFLLVAMAITCVTIKERPLTRRPEATVWQTVFGSFRVDVRGNADFFWLSLSRAVTNLGFYMFLGILLFFVKFSLGDPDPVLGNPDAEGTSMKVMLPAVVAAALSSVPSGILSDRIGRKRLIYLAQFAMAASAIAFTLAPNITVVYIAAVPAGLAYGIFTAVEWALACNLLPRGEAARYLGVWNASAAVPQALAMPLAGALGSAISAQVPGLGWRVDFALTTVCCLVGAYFLVHVRERPRTDQCDVTPIAVH